MTRARARKEGAVSVYTSIRDIPSSIVPALFRRLAAMKPGIRSGQH